MYEYAMKPKSDLILMIFDLESYFCFFFDKKIVYKFIVHSSLPLTISLTTTTRSNFATTLDGKSWFHESNVGESTSLKEQMAACNLSSRIRGSLIQF